jgi:hypothetical protein
MTFAIWAGAPFQAVRLGAASIPTPATTTAIRDTAREIGYAAWNDPTQAPCRTRFGAKYLIQYPPGKGVFLPIYPAGFQRVPLYALANVLIFLAAIFSIWSAKFRNGTAASAELRELTNVPEGAARTFV